MRAADRIITTLPLVELFDERGPVAAVRGRDLIANDIRDLLRTGPLRFVVANCGSRPVWIAESERFAFWKAEVQPHLSGTAEASPDDFPGGYCYWASEWLPASGSPIVLLEMCH